MLDLIEKRLERFALDYVRLDGSVPQRKRQQLVHRFQKTPACRLFMTTNAGSTGLNLQAANTVINVDLPWNPAVLEQRISRAHRMGQKRPVDVYLLVSIDTFEERLLSTLADKRDLALAALDPESNVSELKMRSNMDNLKRRLENLIGEPPVASEDRTLQRKVDARGGRTGGPATTRGRRRQPGDIRRLPAGQLDHSQRCGGIRATRWCAKSAAGLESLVRHDDQGRPQLQLTLPDANSLDQLAGALARLVGLTQGVK